MSQQSFHQQTATGADINFTITTFSSDEIKVYVDGVLKSAGSDYNINPYNANGQSTVDWIGTAPSSPSVVRVVRQTDVMNNGNTAVEGRATFQAGSSVKADDLNNNTKQTLRALQESQDQKVQSYDFEPQAVDTAALRDLEVTREKIHPDAIDGTKLADNAVDSEHYTDGSIDTDHIGNLQVTTSKLADNAVTTVKITDANVTTAKIADSNVTTAKIAADAVNGTKIADNSIDSEHYVDGSIDTAHIGDSQVTTAKIDDNAVTTNKIQNNAVTFAKLATGAIITNSEQSNPSFSGSDSNVFTTAASDARYFNISSGETIKDGQTFPDNDTSIATTAAINDRIIDLVDDVGGFVPIANETSFPTANPDVNNGAGTIVSVSAASTNLVPSGTTVTIANGRGSGLPVVITGVSATIPSGFGFLVETTTTDHTYTFHRLSPKATEVTTVAGNSSNVTTVATNIADINTVANDLNEDTSEIDTVATNIANVNSVGNSIANVNTTAGSIANVNTTAGSIANVNTTAGSISNVNTVAGSISSVNNASSNLNSINNFGDTYQVAANNPSTDGGGNALAAGDLYFNTSANELKVYNGSAWQGGVTATGNFAVTTGTTFTGDNRYNDNVKLSLGTGSDLQLFHSGTNSYIQDNGTGALYIGSNNTSGAGVLIRGRHGEESIIANSNGSVDLYYDNSKKFETRSNGIYVSGLTETGTFLATSTSEFQNNVKFDGATPGTDINFFRSSNSLGFSNNAKANFGGSGNFSIYYDGTDNILKGDSSTVFRNAANNETLAKLTPNGAVELYHDNSKKCETYGDGLEIVAGRQLRFPHANSTDGNDGTISAGVHSEGLTLVGAQTVSGNGRQITHFGNIKPSNNYGTSLGSTSKNYGYLHCIRIFARYDANTTGLYIGADDDIRSYHDGTNSYLTNKTGNFYIGNTTASSGNLILTGGGTDILLQAKNGEDGIKVKPDSSVELYHDNTKRYETHAYGSKITASGAEPHGQNATSRAALNLSGQFGGGLALDDLGNGGFTHFLSGAGAVYNISTAVAGLSTEKCIEMNRNSNVELYFDNSEKLRTNSNGVLVSGNLTSTSLTVNGATSPATINHSGGFGLSVERGSKHLRFNSNYAAAGTHATIDLPGDMELRFARSGTDQIKMDTNGHWTPQTSGARDLGATTAKWRDGHFSRNVNIADNGELGLGDSQDLKLFHDGSSSRIYNSTGDLVIRSASHNLNSADGTEPIIVGTENGAVNLYYDNVLRFRTSSIGTSTTGNAVFNGVTGGNTMQINLPDGNDDSVEIIGGANQGRTTLRMQQGNSNSNSSTGYRIARADGTDVMNLKVDHHHNYIDLMNLKQNGHIRFFTSSSENSNGSVHVVSISSRGSIQGSGDGTARPAYAFTNDTDTGMYRRSSNVIGFATAGVARYFMSGGAFAPHQDNADDLGGTSNRWDDVRATNTNIQSSDRTEKNTINPTDLGLDFINKLVPVSYKWNKTKNGVGKRTHYGLIAQDVETTLKDIGKTGVDFAGFCYDKPLEDADGNTIENPKEYYGLRYGEFMAPMIKAIQELSTEVNNLKTKVAALEAA